MSNTETQRVSRRDVTRVVVVAVVGVMLVVGAMLVVGGFFIARSFWDPQWNLTVAHVVENARPERGVSNPVQVTEATCADAGCVEAYDTSEALYLRFSSEDDAAQYVSTVDDAFQSNYIVMDFSAKRDATAERQRLAMENLVSTWQDFEGTLPSRR